MVDLPEWRFYYYMMNNAIEKYRVKHLHSGKDEGKITSSEQGSRSLIFTQIWNLYIIACCFSDLFLSLKQWTHKVHKMLSWIKDSTWCKCLPAFSCNRFCANFHSRMEGNCLYPFAAVFNKVFRASNSVISSN